MLRNRLSIFVSLPMGSLAKLAMQERLDTIGKPDAEAAQE